MTGPEHSDARSADEGQWPAIARNWRRLGAPLRPGGEDVSFFADALRGWTAESDRAPRGLILGVTPEIHDLPWPDRSLLRAVDRTPEMVTYVWPGNPSDVLFGDWRGVALTDGSVDIAFCDGGLHLLDHPKGQSDLCGELARLIAPGGLFVIRLFVPPLVPEESAQVLDALFRGEIPDLNCLKLRLGMAIQPSAAEGAELHQVWSTLRRTAPDWQQLALRLDWPLDHLLAIDAYRDSPARYHFVTVEEAIAEFCDGTGSTFELRKMDVPVSYEMGAQCPTLTFRRAV